MNKNGKNGSDRLRTRQGSHHASVQRLLYCWTVPNEAQQWLKHLRIAKQRKRVN